MAKKDTENVIIVSEAGTGFFYVKTKTTRGEKAANKLKFRKFDPRAIHPITKKPGAHVDFTQKKLVYKNS